jgi:hypothetical protein
LVQAAKQNLSRRLWRTASVFAAAMYGCLALAALGPAAAMGASTGCQFPNSQYRHVIFVQFDNTHLVRDNPNVPNHRRRRPYWLHGL